MVVVFTIVSAVQEKLTEMVEESKRRKVEEAERKQRQLEEEEQVLVWSFLLCFVFPTLSGLLCLSSLPCFFGFPCFSILPCIFEVLPACLPQLCGPPCFSSLPCLSSPPCSSLPSLSSPPYFSRLPCLSSLPCFSHLPWFVWSSMLVLFLPNILSSMLSGHPSVHLTKYHTSKTNRIHHVILSIHVR